MSDEPESPIADVVVTHAAMAYYGAVPPPAVVEAYERIVPGAADRFIAMAEREQQRRLDKDKADAILALQQEENTRQNYRWGLLISFSLMFVYLAVMFLCFLLKAPSEFLLAMLGVPLISAFSGIVGQFMFKRASEISEPRTE